jgi:Na+/melibiose symporter-like transporter
MTFLTGIGGGLGLASLFGMVPDCSEVTQYRYHTHAIGFVSAFINFAFKLGMAICTAVIGWVLAAYGYVANEAQNEGVLNAINYSMNMVVGIILIIGAVALYFYNIDKKTYSEMLSEVERRIAEKHAL